MAPADVTLMCGKDEIPFWKLTYLQAHPGAMRQLAILAQMRFPQNGQQIHRMLALSQEPPIGLTRQYFVAVRKDNINKDAVVKANVADNAVFEMDSKCMFVIEIDFVTRRITSVCDVRSNAQSM